MAFGISRTDYLLHSVYLRKSHWSTFWSADLRRAESWTEEYFFGYLDITTLSQSYLKFGALLVCYLAEHHQQLATLEEEKG